MALDWILENSLSKGKLVCGTDEAGRGPLAGPVFAAAVILPQGFDLSGLNDSKKLSAKKREAMETLIKEKALAFAVSSVCAEEIDKINILEASLLAMRRAISALSITPELLLVDGNISRGFDIPAQAVVGGDAKLPSVSAASILAKVARDRYCLDMHERFPQYNFAKHKGYGTREHYAAISQHGICAEHRRTFLKKVLCDV